VATDGEAAGRDAADPDTGPPAVASGPAARRAPRSPDAADPPTRPLSLADELFGADDETVHLPRVNESRDDR
jgi:hypothetical protein